jgi:pimeloyl-ACP methyl ester carboxylesterase
MMRHRFFDGSIPAPLRSWYEQEQARVSPDVLLRGVAALIGADLSPRLPSLRAPVLLLHPDSSPFIPVPVMVDLQSRLPDARLHVFGHAKHGLPVSHARQCAAILRAFLDERGG